MNKIKNILFLAVALIVAAGSARAQLYEQIEQRNIWNRGSNVTGVLRDSITISTAALHYDYEEGGFCDFSDGSSVWSAGATAKTITHRDNLSMIGAFSFSHTTGSEMSGSMFISPNSYPVDILEFTPGDKRLQDYYFIGGLATYLTPEIGVGVMAEFRSQNYAKFKDLRHYNYRMDLRFAPSISYKINSSTTLGATYIYTKDSETIRADEIGSTATQYYAFLDKGLMYGTYENWEGGGIHLTESGVTGFPVAQSSNGVAIQLDHKGLYAELEYNHSNGKIGEKQTIWYNFPANSYSARLGYTLQRSNGIHIFSIEANQYEMVNNENVVNSESNNGVTTTIVYGSNQIYSTEQLRVEPKYELLLSSGANIELGACYYQADNRSTLMYPYVESLSLHYYQAYAGGMLPIGDFELRGKLLYSAGGSSSQSTLADSEDNLEFGEAPTQLEEYYNIENEYLTATRLGGSVSLRYNLPRNLYCQIGANYTQAFDLQYIDGNNRWGCILQIGYNF